RLRTSQLSVALTSNTTLLPHWPDAAATRIFAGTVIKGFSSSSTATVKLNFVSFPWVSVAVTSTTVVPIGNALPLGGSAVTLGTSQLSVALTSKTTLLLH